MQIEIHLPLDRANEGLLRLIAEEGTELGRWPCRGKADSARARQEGNPGRDPTRPYGDTPSGGYEPATVVALDPPHPVMGRLCVPLNGTSGAALQAKLNGRKGLAIHGGRGDDRLVATHGCIRMYDKDINRLHQLLDTVEAEITVIDVGGDQ